MRTVKLIDPKEERNSKALLDLSLTDMLAVRGGTQVKVEEDGGVWD